MTSIQIDLDKLIDELVSYGVPIDQWKKGDLECFSGSLLDVLEGIYGLESQLLERIKQRKLEERIK